MPQASPSSAPLVFIDCEFTDLLRPELLSLGAVTLEGREHYVELDLATDVGRARAASANDLVREQVLCFWGSVPSAACTQWEMGRRTAEWLLGLAAESGTRVEVAYDYVADIQLMEQVIRDCGHWDSVREVIVPVNVDPLTGTIEGELAAEECFGGLLKRNLRRHHALADALALRAAYGAVKGSLTDPSRDRQ